MGWYTLGGSVVGGTTLHGLEDYNDTATATTPIAMPLADTWYNLTSDGLGPNSQTALKLPGNKNTWNTTSNQLELDDLTIGDTVDLRIDVDITTTSANEVIELGLRLAAGSGSSFVLSVGRQYFKTAGTEQIVLPYWFYIGSALVRDNPAELVIKSDGTGDSCVVNGFAIRTSPRLV